MTSDFDVEKVRKLLADALGWNDYNRLIASVPEVRQRGRLRFWQERLLEQASQTGVVLSTSEEFLKIFDGALPVSNPDPEPWTKEVFLRRIVEWPHGGFPMDETPPEWMAAAWEIESVRDELCREMARTVSKLGELYYTKEYLHYLSQALPISRQVELFLYIRDRCPGREEEFRPGFEQAFPQCVPQLPPPLTMKQVADELGITVEEYERQNFPFDGSPANQDYQDEIPIEDEENDIPF